MKHFQGVARGIPLALLTTRLQLLLEREREREAERLRIDDSGYSGIRGKGARLQ